MGIKQLQKGNPPFNKTAKTTQRRTERKQDIDALNAIADNIYYPSMAT